MSGAPLLRASAVALALLSPLTAWSGTNPPPGITLGAPVVVAPPDYAWVNQTAQRPAVATNGTDSLVAWSTGTSFGAGLAFARFTAAGTLLDPEANPLSTLLSGAPFVAWNGSAYVVFAGSAGQVVYPSGMLGGTFKLSNGGSVAAYGGGQTLALNGTSATVYDSNWGVVGEVTLPFAASVSSAEAAAWSGGTFLVAWQDGPDGLVSGVRISSAGALLDAAPFAIDPGTPIAGAGADGGSANAELTGLTVGGASGEFLVAWVEMTAGPWNLYGTTVSLAGTVAHPGGVPLITDATSKENPELAANGAGFWLTWSDTTTTNVHVAPIATDGTAGTATTVTATSASPSFSAYPVIAAAPATTFLAWSIGTGETATGETGSAIAGVRLGPSGAQLDAQPIWLSTYLAPASHPVLTASPTGYLATWSEQYTQLSGVRLALDGTPFDAQPLALGAAFQGVSSLAPAGGGFLATWTSTDQQLVYLEPIPATGAPGAILTLTPSTMVLFSSVACATDRCVVSWQLDEGTGTPKAEAEIVDVEGNVLVPRFTLPLAAPVSNGSSFLLVTTDTTGADYASILQPDGTLGTATYFSSASVHSVAWGLDRYVTIGTTPSFQSIFVDRLGATGSLLEPETSYAGSSPMAPAALVWNGRAFFGAQAPDGTGGQPPSAEEIAPSGSVASTAPFTIFDTETTAIAAASGVAGEALVAAPQPEGKSGASRIVARRIQFALDGGAGDGGASADGGAASVDGGASDGGADASGLDASPPGDAGSSSSADGSTDANGASEASSRSSCGCHAAGSGSASGGAMSFFALGLVLACARRARYSCGEDER